MTASEEMSRKIWFGLAGGFVLGMSLIAAYALRVEGSSQVTADQPIQLPEPPSIDLSLVTTVLPPDSIESINDPQFESAEEAAPFLSDDERVIGLVINGDARAYPIPVLSVHEVVNDVVGGEPIAVTWCPLCYSALIFSREVEGYPDPLSLGVSGKLLRNTLILYDRQTETLWSQLYGSAIEGELAGSVLKFFPSVLTEWSVWRQQHPDTLVLSKAQTCQQFACRHLDLDPGQSYLVDRYESYYRSSEEGLIDSQIPRDELDPAGKTRVLGVRVAELSRAYPYEALAQIPLINDQLGDLPILIWFDPDTETGAAYLRRLDTRLLTFDIDTDSPGVLLDRETGSHWLASTGEAVTGPLAGSRLTGLAATPAFEFGWFGYFPDSEIFRPE